MSMTITKKQDKYYLVNTEGVSLNYVITYSDGCSELAPFLTGTFSSSSTPQIIPFSKDGKYRFVVTNPNTTASVAYDVPVYNDMQTSILYSTEDLLCNCDSCCKGGCSQHQTKCDKLQSLLNRYLFYSSLIGNPYCTLVDNQMVNNICLYSDELICDVNSEIIRGEIKNNERLTQILIAFNYIAMYQYEYSMTVTAEDIEYVNKKFKWNTIQPCLRDLSVIVAPPIS